MLDKYIYKLGVKLRNPSLVKYYNFLKVSEKWSLDELKNYQFNKAKDFLQFAYKYSDYYKFVFDNVGFVPSKMQSLDDMKIIPIIDKSVLLEKNQEIHTKYKFKKVRFSETSGTSGQVLNFYRNEEWDSAHRAAMFRGYSWYNINPWDRNGYFWGYNIAPNKIYKTKILDLLQNRFRIFSYNTDAIENFSRELKNAKYISGYSSMIYEVAKHINANSGHFKIKEFKLKMVKGTSEKIFDSYQDEVYKAFGKKMISEYGAGESGIIAYECPEAGNMHINMENVIVEVIDGEIVVTNLLSRSFPIIRYKLGDYIELADPNYQCPCGRKHQIVINVLGRVGKNIYGKQGKYPSLMLYYVFKNLAINKGINLNYQVIQNEKGSVDVKIEQDSPECEILIKDEFAKYFKDDVNVQIYFGEMLHLMNGKLKDFISNINISNE